MSVSLYLLSNAFRIYMIYKMIRVFLEECKVERQYELISYTLYFVINSLVYLMVKTPVYNMIINLSATFLITLLYKANMKGRVFATMILYVVTICVECALMCFMNIVPAAFVSTSGTLYGADSYFMANFAMLPVVMIMEKLKAAQKGENVSWSFWLLSIIMTVSSMYITILLTMVPTGRRIFSAVGVVLLLMINIMIYKMYDLMSFSLKRITEEKMQNQQNESYKKQLDLYKEYIDKTRAMRHDWKNHLGVIEVMIENHQIAELQKYTKNLMYEIQENKIYSSSGNTTVDSIVNYKCHQAGLRHIKINTMINLVNQTFVNDIDWTILLGNLMDNAIRGAEEANQEKYISLSIKQERGNIRIIIENSYSGEVKYEKNQYTTTKEDKKNHGIGMQQIEKVVQNYNGMEEIKHSELKFYVSIILFERSAGV